MNEEQEERKQKMLEKLSEIDKKSKEYKQQKEHEKRLAIEMESIKKKERLDEAKRLERMKHYKRQKEMEIIDHERSKSVMIKNKREEVLNTRKTINNQAIIMKRQIKNRIDDIKAKKPDKISKVNIIIYKS